MEPNETPPPNPDPAPAPAASPAAPPVAPPPPAGPPNHTYAMLCHLLAFCGFIGIPFGNILGPLVLWLIKKDTDPEVNLHGKESLNFQITMTIATIISGLLIMVLVGMVLLPALLLANIVLTIIATVKASNGEFYRYPVTWRVIE